MPAASEEPLHLHLSWYRPCDGDKEFVETYFRLAREFFPPAVPTRFGLYEPLQGNLLRDGDSAFGQMYRDKCRNSDLLFKGKALKWGRINGWYAWYYMRFQRLWVTFDLAALERARVLGDVERFFVEVAEQSGSFFASAEVNRILGSTADSPHYKGGWSGLPSRPQWLTWYSSGYQDLVLPSLTTGTTTRHAEGMSHRWTEMPSTAEEIEILLGRDAWVPSELVAPDDPDDHRSVLEPAAIMPPALRTT